MVEAKVTTTKDINRVLREQIQKNRAVRIGGLAGHHNIAVGIDKDVRITVEGDAGDFFGALNSGAKIHLKGKCGRYLADTMFDGEIFVDGDVSTGACAHLLGGVVVIKGDVKGSVGTMNRGTIVISGNVEGDIGLSMREGEIIICGNAHGVLGERMNGGVVYLGGEAEKFGRHTKIGEMKDTDRNRLRELLAHYGIKANLALFEKIVPERDE